MSDGPYKSLPLSRTWKKVAKCAGSDAYSVADIRDTFSPALAEDWRAGQLDVIVRTIRDLFDLNQGSLYDRVGQLESMLASASGNGLRQTLIECAIQATSTGIE